MKKKTDRLTDGRANPFERCFSHKRYTSVQLRNARGAKHLAMALVFYAVSWLPFYVSLPGMCICLCHHPGLCCVAVILTFPFVLGIAQLKNLRTEKME